MNEPTITVTKLEGGYVVTDIDGRLCVQPTINSVFDLMLLKFEGRANTFSGDKYGSVVVKLVKEG